MKTLHLLRHAKSSWDEPWANDRERGLNKRGRRDAPRMGRALCAELQPMPVFVSPARRAQLTLEGVCETWPDMVGRFVKVIPIDYRKALERMQAEEERDTDTTPATEEVFHG